jgi:hypothetical protein
MEHCSMKQDGVGPFEMPGADPRCPGIRPIVPNREIVRCRSCYYSPYTSADRTASCE